MFLLIWRRGETTWYIFEDDGRFSNERQKIANKKLAQCLVSKMANLNHNENNKNARNWRANKRKAQREIQLWIKLLPIETHQQNTGPPQKPCVYPVSRSWVHEGWLRVPQKVLHHQWVSHQNPQTHKYLLSINRTKITIAIQYNQVQIPSRSPPTLSSGLASEKFISYST